MTILRFLVYETDADERKRLVEDLESGGISVVDAFDKAFVYDDLVYRDGTLEVIGAEKVCHPEKVVNECLWLKPERLDGMIVGGPDKDRKNWHNVLRRQGYRLRESMRVYSHCSGDGSEFVKDRLTHGNLDRDFGKGKYFINLAHLLQEATV